MPVLPTYDVLRSRLHHGVFTEIFVEDTIPLCIENPDLFKVLIYLNPLAREAAVPEDPLFGTRIFVCAKNWVVRHSRSLNVHEGPWAV